MQWLYSLICYCTEHQWYNVFAFRICKRCRISEDFEM